MIESMGTMATSMTGHRSAAWSRAAALVVSLVACANPRGSSVSPTRVMAHPEGKARPPEVASRPRCAAPSPTDWWVREGPVLPASLSADGLWLGDRVWLVSSTAVAGFDPDTERWEHVESIPGRTGARTVAIGEDRLLRVGGQVLGLSSPDAVEVAQVFVPGAGWSAAGQLELSRVYASATALQDGDVLLVGGRGAAVPYPQGASRRVERWKAAASRFEPVAQLDVARWDHAAVRLEDGRVLVIGGKSLEAEPLGSVQVFDPSRGGWSFDPPLPAAVPDPSATTVGDGRVVVSSSAGLFARDPDTGAWTIVSAVGLPQSRVIGFSDCTVVVLGELELQAWDLRTGRRRQRASPMLGRLRPGTTRLDEQRILVAGGHVSGELSRTTEIWSRAPDASPPEAELSWQHPEFMAAQASDDASDDASVGAVRIDPQRILELRSGSGPRIVEPRRREAIRLAEDPDLVRDAAALAPVPGGGALLVGGRRRVATGPEAENPRPDADIGAARRFDATSSSWISMSQPHTLRWGATATPIDDGRIVVLGGATSRGVARGIEVWDPTTDRWTSAGRLSAGRLEHAATAVSAGVLVTGACAPGDPGASRVTGGADRRAELWRSDAARAVPAGRSSDPRCGHVAVRLGDGRVLVAGGFADGRIDALGRPTGGRRLASVEIWDPEALRFVPAAPMSTGRAMAAAVVRSDGRVMVVGGQAPEPTQMPTAELYDPSTDRWHVLGPVPRDWSRPGLIPIDDDRILVFADQATVELRLTLR